MAKKRKSARNSGDADGISERLLRTADRLFYREGIQAVGIDRLLGEAGVAKASLYAHFASKDALIGAWLDRRAAESRQRSEAHVLTTDLPARDKILRLFDERLAWVEAEGFRGCPFVNAAAELADPAHPVHAVTAAHRAWLHETISGLVREAGLPAPALLAGALTVLLDGAAATALVDGDPGAAADARWAAARLIGDGDTAPSRQLT